MRRGSGAARRGSPRDAAGALEALAGRHEAAGGGGEAPAFEFGLALAGELDAFLEGVADRRRLGGLRGLARGGHRPPGGFGMTPEGGLELRGQIGGRRVLGLDGDQGPERVGGASVVSGRRGLARGGGGGVGLVDGRLGLGQDLLRVLVGGIDLECALRLAQRIAEVAGVGASLGQLDL